MELSERNSRLVLVFGGIGLSGFLFNMIGKFIKQSYSTFDMHASIPFSISQLFSSLILSSFVVILGLGVVYCFFELFSYSNMPTDIKSKYSDKADKYYTYLLKYAAVSLIVIFIILIVYTYFVEFVYMGINLNLFLIGFLILFLIVLIILLCIKKTRSNIAKGVKSLFKTIGSFFNTHNFAITLISLFSWIMCFIITFVIGINSNTNAGINVGFDNKNFEITFKYEDSVVDFVPKKISVDIISNKEIIEDFQFDSKDFKQSYVFATQTNLETKTKEQVMLINKNNFIYTKSLILESLKNLDQGKIVIQFERDDLLTKEVYTIQNQFFTEDGEILFDYPEIKIDF